MDISSVIWDIYIYIYMYTLYIYMGYLRHLLTGTPEMVQLSQQNSGVSGGRVFFWMADLVGKSRN